MTPAILFIMIISRDMYRKIKQMDREQLETFLTNLYHEGMNDAIKAPTPEVPNSHCVTEEDILNAIGTVKGIGEKRLVEIGNAIKKLFIERRD